jgi:hypothetical protein
MTTVEDSERISTRAGRLPGAAATAAIFLIVGPFAGGGTIFVALSILHAVPPDFAHDPKATFFYSCLTVFIPVLVVGALVAARQVMERPITSALAAGLGASGGVVWGLFLASEGATATLSVLAFFGSIVATLVCWWLTRLFAGRR